MARRAAAIPCALLLAHAAAAQFTQQGAKLVGTAAVGPTPWQGNAVALSADGSTAIIGGPGDATDAGAAWVFTRSDGAWSQQGPKLVGTGASGTAEQGWSVAISADGNTAIVGGPSDNAWTGAAWVFTRSNDVWWQQGPKLVASDSVDASQQGIAVALTADGDTALVGGAGDNAYTGAAWVYTRSGGAWSQQGPKLTALDSVGAAYQGWSAALSADGNTAIIGGYQDTFNVGAAWVFVRSGSTWSQQGPKLVGASTIGANIYQGSSVALSADGDTAIVGGDGDGFNSGAAWVFTRSDGAWSQQGPKLVGTGASGTAEQGWSVALSADGDTAVVGGPQDSSLSGAVWEFTRSAGVWAQRGSKLVGAGALGLAQEGASVAISADGATAVVGGPTDYWAGATWAFATPGCAPSITSQPQSQRVGAGLSATLSVAAVGTAPLAYQWYEGVAGDASHPVGTDAATFTTPALTVATSYWVRVSNSCGHAYSATAIVTVGSSPRRHLRRAG